jgi:hypothetical protein
MSIAVKISAPIASDFAVSREPRERLLVDTTVRTTDAMPLDASLFDVSRSGCLLSVNADIGIGSVISIGISGIGRVDALVLRNDGDLYGCQFLQMLPNKFVDIIRQSDTVVKFTGMSIPHPAAFDNEMPEPNRRYAAFCVIGLFGFSCALWALIVEGIKLI